MSFMPLFRMLTERIGAVIPAKGNGQTPIPHNREECRWRNLIGRLFGE